QINTGIKESGGNWELELTVTQENNPYHFLTSVQIDTREKSIYHLLEIKNQKEFFSFTVEDKPERLIFNTFSDIPSQAENYYTWSNFFDDYHHTLMVYGTSRQIEANHTLALRFSRVLADRYTEILPPVKKDSELSLEDLKNHDLIVLGNVADNRLTSEMLSMLGLNIQKNMFVWEGEIYAGSDEGLFVSFPNPYNPGRTVYLFTANSALQLYQMTKDRLQMPSWAIYQGDKIVKKGYLPNQRFTVEFE
ncbi:MAG: hypothetical protein JSW33_11220, partial [bacterium]